MKKKKKMLFHRALSFVSRKISLIVNRIDHFFKPTKYTQIIICGFPRGGTSLVFNMLTATMPEYKNMGREASALSVIAKRGNWITKLPRDISNLKKISKSNFRKKKILVMILFRDPRDAITSVHRLLPDRYYMGFDERGFNQCGLGAIYESCQEVLESPPEGLDVVTVYYESLCLDPLPLQSEIEGKMFHKFDTDLSNFHLLKEGMAYRSNQNAEEIASEEITSIRIDKWRDPKHFDRIRSQFERFPKLFTMLEELGYETDRRWFQPYKRK